MFLVIWVFDWTLWRRGLRRWNSLGYNYFIFYTVREKDYEKMLFVIIN